MKIPVIKGFDEEAFHKYVKNTGWLMIARVGSLGIKILVGFAVARYLSPKQFGIFNYPMALATFFIAAAALGVDGFVTRELLRTPERKNALLGTAFILKLAGGFAILPLIYAAYYIISHAKPLDTPLSYVMIVSLAGISQSFNIIDSYFQSRSQGKYIMMVQIAGNIVSAAIKLILIFCAASLTWFIFALLLDTVLLAAGYLYLYQNEQDNSIFKWNYESAIAKFLLKHSWPLAFSAILVSVYMSIDKLMVEYILGTTQLATYSTVVQLAESWYFIPVAIVTSIFPAIMNARRDDQERYMKRMQNMYDLMVWISLILAIFMTFASTYIYQIFLPKYISGAHVLSIHIWAGIFVFLGTASGQFLIAEGYTKLSMMRTAAGALVNIVLNLFWIPKFGIAGAAFATLIAYAVSAFCILLIPKTRQQGIMMLKSLFLITLLKKLKLY